MEATDQRVFLTQKRHTALLAVLKKFWKTTISVITTSIVVTFIGILWMPDLHSSVVNMKAMAVRLEAA